MIPDVDYMRAGAEIDALVSLVFALPEQRYSSDIVAAIGLLDHVAGRKFYSYSICNTDGTGSDPLCVVEIFAGSGTRIGCGETHNSDALDDYKPDTVMALAICRAVLDAARVNAKKLNVENFHPAHRITVNPV